MCSDRANVIELRAGVIESCFARRRVIAVSSYATFFMFEIVELSLHNRTTSWKEKPAAHAIREKKPCPLGAAWG